MQLLEVKNDIAKIIYNPADNKLLPSDFLLIEDLNQKLVAQILSVSTTDDLNNNVADVRLALYIDKDEKLSYYNGYIPSKTAKIIYITADEITEMITDAGANIYLGNLTYHPKSIVKIPMSLVNDRLYIQCDRADNTKIIIQNLLSELYSKKRKSILVDFDGRFAKINNVPKLVLSESFKFPLNIDAFNTILEYDTSDCPIEDKAVIQSIVLELRDYISTLDSKFLPFTLFKNVVLGEFAANPISGLMLLRNKLWQYGQEGLFAESKADFDIINTVMQNENLVIVDASKIEEKWHKFVIQTIPKILNVHSYFAFSMNDIPMDKRSIVSLYNNSNIIPIVSTSYDSPYRNILKSLSKNQILFKPSKKIDLDEKYNALVNKLNDNDFILFGDASLGLPLIISLKPFDITTPEIIEDLEIQRDVDRMLSTGKSMLPKEAVISSSNKILEPNGQIIIDEDFTDEDLDFLDNRRSFDFLDNNLKNNRMEYNIKDGYGIFNPEEDNTADEIVEEDTIENPSEEESNQSFNNEEQFIEQIDFQEVNNSENLITDNSKNVDESLKYDIPYDFEEKNDLKQENQNETESSIVKDAQYAPNDNEINIDDGENQNIDEEIQQEQDVIAEEQSDNSEFNEDEFEYQERDNESEYNSTEKQEEVTETKEEENSQAKNKRLTNSGTAGYYKNAGANMDVVPDEPILKTYGNLKYKEEDVNKESASEIPTIDSLPIEKDTEINQIDEDYVELDENGKEIVNNNYTNDEKELEDIFSDDISDDNETENLISETEEEADKQDEDYQDDEEAQDSEFDENSDDLDEDNKEEDNNEEDKLLKKDDIVPLNSVIENIKTNSIKKIKEKKNSFIEKLKKNSLKSKQTEVQIEKIKKQEIKPSLNEVKNRTIKKELPLYETDLSSDVAQETKLPFKVGDKVFHPKHGKGVVEGFANYSNKILFCQIEFENVGRRILDPRISGLEKIK